MRRVAVLAIVIVLAAIAGVIYLIVGADHHRGTAICIRVGGRQRVPASRCSGQPRSATPAYVTWYVFGPTPPVGAQVTGGAPTPTTRPSHLGPT